MPEGKTAKPWWVYVIGPEDGPIKIGISTNPEQRRCEIQTGNPRNVFLWRKFGFATRKRAFFIEKRLHYLLRWKKCKGEWFAFPARDAVAKVECTLYRLWKNEN